MEHQTPPEALSVESKGNSGAPFSWSALIPVAWFATLLILAFLPTLRLLVGNWIENEDMGHGFFVPAVAAYIAWQKRDELQWPAPHSWLGLALLVASLAQLYVATLGVELFLARSAFVLAVIGSVWWMSGTSNLRRLGLPLILLFFMIPLPAIIYNQITFPLQLLASRVAEQSLAVLGIPVLRDGNILELPSQRLSVVEACSGIRSLLSLSFLSLVYGHFFDHRPWMKWLLLVVTVPVAVLANSIRVTATGILSEYNPALAQGLFHSLEGWVIFMAALAMLVAAHKLIQLLLRLRSSSPFPPPAQR
jgi:exosortase